MNAQIKITKLHEYETRQGKRFLRGYLGNAIVRIYRDERAEAPPNGFAVWNMFLEEKPPADQKTTSQKDPAHERN